MSTLLSSYILKMCSSMLSLLATAAGKQVPTISLKASLSSSPPGCWLTNTRYLAWRLASSRLVAAARSLSSSPPSSGWPCSRHVGDV